MTRNDILTGDFPPDLTLHRLIDSHGVWATLRAFLRVLATRRRTRVDVDALPDHLRRDIGLNERDPWLDRGPRF